MKSKTNKAFSLIELSIVILVIGILIAGVSQGVKLYDKFKLQTARTITQSSPVAGIKDLVMWLETTSVASFDNGDRISNNTAIQNWYDINPQRTGKFNVTQNSASSKRPLYLEKGINGLPALSFDGTDDGMDFSSADSSHLNVPFTIFVVKQPKNSGYYALQYIISRRTANNNGTVIFDNPRINLIYSSTGTSIESNAGATVKNKAHIMVATVGYNSAAQIAPQLRYNNNSWLVVTTPVSGFVNDSSMPAGVGYRRDANANFYSGLIAEIIIYNRVLNSSEISDIQAYLKKKWSISY